MTLKRPLFMQASGADPALEYSALDTRALAAAIWRSEGVVRHGTAGAGALKAQQRAAGANFSVDVQPGYAVIEGDDVSSQGLYVVHSTAVENLVIPSPPGAGTRTHRVVAQVRDKTHDGSWSTYDWTPLVLEDTGSGTPAVPDSAIPLARVTVAAAQVSVLDANIVDDRINAMTLLGRAAFGGTDADRPANPVDGELFRRTDEGVMEIAVGGTWYDIYLGGSGPAWTSYTPVLTATSSNPTLGSGSTASGAWQRDGRRVTARVVIKFGTSGVGAGSGFYEVTLPVTARTLSVGRQVGSAYAYDSSATNFADGICFTDTGATTKVRLSIDSTVVANNWPATWAANDEFGFQITYEAAS